MSAVIKAKNFEFERVVLGEPNRVIDKNYVVPLRYGTLGPIRVQIPRTSIFQSIYENNGKFYMDLVMRVDGTFHNFYRSMLGFCNAAQSTFPNCEVKAKLKRIHDDAYSARIKLPRNGNNFQFKVWNTCGVEIPPNTMSAGDEVICILDVECLYVSGSIISFNFLLHELKKVCP